MNIQMPKEKTISPIEESKKIIRGYVDRETRLTLKDRVSNFLKNSIEHSSDYVLGGAFLAIGAFSFYGYSVLNSKYQGLMPTYGQASEIVGFYNASQGSKVTSDLIKPSQLEVLLDETSKLLEKGARFDNGTKALKIRDEIEETRNNLPSISKKDLNHRMEMYGGEINSLTERYDDGNILIPLGILSFLFGTIPLGIGVSKSIKDQDRTGKEQMRREFDFNFSRLPNDENVYRDLNLLVENEVNVKNVVKAVRYAVNTYDYPVFNEKYVQYIRNMLDND